MMIVLSDWSMADVWEKVQLAALGRLVVTSACMPSKRPFTFLRTSKVSIKLIHGDTSNLVIVRIVDLTPGGEKRRDD